MSSRIASVLAIAVVAFYVGVALEAAPTGPTRIEVPDSVTTIAVAPRIRESVSVVAVRSHTDRLQTVAALAALLAVVFLLARGGLLVVRRVRARRAAQA